MRNQEFTLAPGFQQHSEEGSTLSFATFCNQPRTGCHCLVAGIPANVITSYFLQKYYEPDPRFESDGEVRGRDGVEGRLQGVLISRLVYGSALYSLYTVKNV
jgi:hypothetical protein